MHAYAIIVRTARSVRRVPGDVIAHLIKVETTRGMISYSGARHRASAASLALLGVVLLVAVACVSGEAGTSVQETPHSQTVVKQASASATPGKGTVAAQASSTITRQLTPTETSSPTWSPTQTMLPSVTLTPLPSPTHWPVPSPTPRRLRVLVPEALIGRATELAPFVRNHPAYTFLVEVAPSSLDVAVSVGRGHADLGIYEGLLPAGLTAHAYRSEPVAAIVSFYKRLEGIAMADLVSLFEGAEDARARLGIGSVGAWEPAVMGSDDNAIGDAVIAAPDDLVLRAASDGNVLALVPFSALVSSVRALSVDGHGISDANYPLMAQEAVLAADVGLSEFAKEMADVLAQSVVVDPLPVELAVVGDIMLARDMGDALREHGPDYAFGDVRHMLEGADLTLGNLECVIGDRGEPEPKAYTFQAPLTAATSLGEAGFDLLNVANNHILDFGPEAMAQTFDLLSEAGIDWTGAGMSEGEAHAPVLRDVRGLRIAFLGYARYMTETSTGFPAGAFVAVGDKPGIAWADVDRIGIEIAEAKTRADVVVVALHGGREYWERPTDFQREAARAAIDAGASLVWGHHAHSWQGIEFYKEGVILYSLGDFVFDQMTTNDTAVARLWIDARGVRQLWLEPVVIVENGRPVPAPEQKGRAILDWLYGLSELLLD